MIGNGDVVGEDIALMLGLGLIVLANLVLLPALASRERRRTV